jgi:hypothetical protein
LAASTEEPGESKKGRRRRKTKTKDSFNHMQRFATLLSHARRGLGGPVLTVRLTLRMHCRKCASCQRTETTKWRHGPLGSNTYDAPSPNWRQRLACVELS